MVVPFPQRLTWHASRGDEGLDSPCEFHELPLNGRLYYCSGQEQGSSGREDSPVVSEEIEKDTIKGDLIYASDCSTYAAILRAQTSVYIGWLPTNCTLIGSERS